jgi:hypothetical protein
VDYDLRLRESGADYIAEKAISYYLKPGEVEGIGVHIYCEKSSVHEFMASVRVKGQWITAQDNFKLH